MPDGERRPRTAPTTPVPTSTLEDVRDVVTRTHANVNMLRKEILPPLIEDTRHARDTAREALQGLTDHKNNESVHSHRCAEQDRQKQQDEDLDHLKTKVSDTKTVAASAMVHVNNTTRLVWWVVGVAGTIITASVIFAISVRVSTAENTSHIEVNKNDIAEHDQEIRVIRDTFMKEIRELPNEVTRAARSVPAPKQSLDIQDIETAINDMNVTEYEKRSIQRILKRAQLREVTDGN